MIRALLLLCLSATAFAGLPDRLYLFGSTNILWSRDIAGVPGGIPSRTTIFTNLGSSTTTNFSTDITAMLSNAIVTCPSNQVVYLPAGDYKLNNQIQTLSASYVTIRGEVNASGYPLTVLHTAGGFSVGQGDVASPSTFPKIISGATRGSSNIVLESASGFVTNRLMELRAFGKDTNYWNTFTGPQMLVATNGGATGGIFNRNSQASQVVYVTGVSGSTVSFWPPLYMDLTNNGVAMTYASHIAKNIGFENLKITPQDTNGSSMGTVTAMIDWQQTYGGWCSNVVVYKNSRRGFRATLCVLGEWTGCWMDTRDAVPIVSANGECLDLSTGVTGYIIENSIAQHQFPGINLSDAARGIVGNVILNNYSTGDASEGDIQVNHGGGTMFNLFEGNVSSGRFNADSYTGTSMNNTLHRNWGYDTTRWPVQFDRWSYSNNVIRNVWGTNSFTYSRLEATDSTAAVGSIYRLGFPNPGNSFIQFVTNSTIVYPGTMYGGTGTTYTPVTLTADAVATTNLQGNFTGWTTGSYYIAIQDSSNTNRYVYADMFSNGSSTGLATGINFLNFSDSRQLEVNDGTVTAPAGSIVYRVYTDRGSYQTYRPEVKATLIRAGNYDEYSHSIDTDPSVTTDVNSLWVPYQSARPSYWRSGLRYPAIQPESATMVTPTPAMERVLGEFCTWSINPTSTTTSYVSATGYSLAVTTSDSSCDWTATANVSWLHVTAGTSGTGNGTVTYSVDQNPNGTSRSGTLTVAGNTFTVTQGAAPSGSVIRIGRLRR